MFVGELKSLHKTERLVDRATDWQVVNGYLPQDAFIVNDEEASEKERSMDLNWSKPFSLFKTVTFTYKFLPHPNPWLIFVSIASLPMIVPIKIISSLSAT